MAACMSSTWAILLDQGEQRVSERIVQQWHAAPAALYLPASVPPRGRISSLILIFLASAISRKWRTSSGDRAVMNRKF